MVAEEEAPLLAGVRLLALDSHDDVRVWEEAPAFVVMYDPDIAFIRQLEVNQCDNVPFSLIGSPLTSADHLIGSPSTIK